MSAEGSGKISLALGKRPLKPAPTNGIKRSHAALREDEDDGQEEGRAQTVSHFDKSAGGAIDEAKHKPENTPLAIAPQANRDWREANRDWREASQRKRQRHGLPPEAQQNGTVSEQAIKDLEAQKPKFGLNVTNRDGNDDQRVSNDETDQGEVETEAAQQHAPEPSGDTSIRQKTDDELATDALLGRTTKQNLVLPAMTEEEAFEQDYRSAPDMATLDDYARVPVEQFGAALLRGMGWKDGEGIGANKGKKVEKTKMPERRPALLGIGAKEEAAVAQEMGTWGKAAKKGGEVKVYNPVLLRDRTTGKLYTEEELQKRRERDERKQYEEEFDRKEREKERRRRRQDGDDSRDKDRDRRDRDRRRERERRDDGDRRRYDDSDEEYYRRKEKERRRRERDRRDDSYDRERERERSVRYDDDRDKRRERDTHRHHRR